MIATGTVRKIDELGRIVIPKSVREQLRIGSRQQIEMYVNEKKQVALQKYQPLREQYEMVNDFVYSLAQSLSCGVCIADEDGVLAGVMEDGKPMNVKSLTEDMTRILEDDHPYMPANEVNITSEVTAVHSLWFPLQMETTFVGSLGMFSSTREFTLEEEKLAKVFLSYLQRRFA